jgi:hypothetical protein
VVALTRVEPDRSRRQRSKNLALAFALAALVILFFVVSLVRMGGGG